MILADTSIWIDHLRNSDEMLIDMLRSCQVATHPFIIGEISLGNLKNRGDILRFLHDLPKANVANNDEVSAFIENNSLYGAGIGYIDAHLLASSLISSKKLWTRDKKLNEIAKKLGIAYLYH